MNELLRTSTLPALPSPIENDLHAALQSDQFLGVRRRIFRQLIESLIYEGVARPEVVQCGDRQVYRLHCMDEAARPVVYVCSGQRRFSFNRIRLGTMPVTRTAAGQTVEADSLSRFLLEMRGVLGGDDDRLVHLIRELEQTLLNDTLAQYRRRQDGWPLRNCSYDEMESYLADAHPYHPSYKSRMGWDYLDNVTFGPEFGPVLQPIWLAACREWARTAIFPGWEPMAFVREEVGDDIFDQLVAKICQRGCDPEDYLLIPVHPWQWREKIVPAFHEDFRENQLIHLGTADESYRPQQSIRTLANLTSPGKSSLKLSLSIVNTSTSRILAPHTVQNAPLISEWLKTILEKDTFLRDQLRPVLLGEVLGIAYDRPQPELIQSHTYGTLACIWRESLHAFLDPAEEAMPFNALCHLDVDGRPLIDPWVQRDGLRTWVRRLLAASVLPVVHFLYAHGIALEAHAQNMVLIHEQGVPRRVALKDFHDGIRFAPAHLAAPEDCPALLATPLRHARVNRNSYIEAETAEEVRDFVHDAFFFINLAEFALFLADQYGFEERRFWSLVRAVIVDYQQRYPHLRERFMVFDLFAPTIQVEQLTKRRLYPETEVRVHAVPNPLATEAAGD